MAAWVDLRIAPEEATPVIRALAHEWPGITVSVDTRPNRASDSPEWNVEVPGHTERDVLRLMREWGIDVLASREQTVPPGACASRHPETREPCAWPEGHLRALVDPICDGRGALVDHSWAVPLFSGRLRIRWVD